MNKEKKTEPLKARSLCRPGECSRARNYHNNLQRRMIKTVLNQHGDKSRCAALNVFGQNTLH